MKNITSVIILIVSILSFSGSITAQTEINGGNVSGTWTKSNSPYIINEDISIQKEFSLIIEPGVEVKFGAHVKLSAFGRLLAVGTLADSVRFTAIDTAVGWGGIRFLDQNDWAIQPSEIAFSVFSYGKVEVGTSYPKDSTSGGAIGIINSSNVEIRNSCFNNNSANDGGAVYIKDSDPLILNTVFNKNKAVNQGINDVVTGGGAIRLKNSSAKLLHCDFYNNYSSSWGGAISTSDSSRFVMKYLNVVNNFGDFSIFIESSAPFTFKNININNNDAGGIYTITSSLFGTHLINVTIANNNSTALKVEGGLVILQNSIVANNNGYYTVYVSGDLMVLNGVLVNNHNSDDVISGYSDWGDNFPATIMNSVIWGNDHGLDNPPVPADENSISVFYSDVQGSRSEYINWGTGVVKVEPGFINSVLGNYHLSYDSPLIDAGNPDPSYNDEFVGPNAGRGTERNDMGAYGGAKNSWGEKPTADFMAEKLIGSVPLEVQFVDKSFGATEYNWDFNNDGIVESTEKNPIYTFNQAGVFSVTLIVKSGGYYSDTLTINDYITAKETHFSGNVSGVWDVDTVYVDGDITVPRDQSLTIMPGTVVYFTGKYKMQVEGQLTADGMEDNNITFTSSTDLPWQGIRFWLNDENNQPASSIENCMFTNSKYQDGMPPYYGTIFYKNTDAHISNSTFHNTSNVNLHRSGGEIYGSEFNNGPLLWLDSSTVLIANCRFDSSAVSIYNSSPQIDSCVIEHSMNGSDVVGIYGYNSSPVITNTIIRNNGGGGVSFNNSSPVLKFVTIENNHKNIYGGGGYFSNSNVVMTNVIVKGNSVVQSGAGLYFTASSTGDNYTATLDNCLIVNNSVTYEYDAGGSGTIFNGNYTGNFTNCTIADNSGKDWAGVMLDGSSNAYLNNSIVWNNGNNLDFQAGGLYTYSIIQGNYVGQDSATTNLDNVDPLFRDAANGDYHLQSMACGNNQDSPAIDAGHPAIADFVLDCSAGLETEASDIGAYGGANNWWDRTSSAPPCYFSGDVSGVWDCDTVHVIGDILVPAGETLEITPNVKCVYITGPYQIKVEGRLLAHGPENVAPDLNSNQMLFTGSNWHGIYFHNTNSSGEPASEIENCRFDNTDKMDITYQGGGAIIIINSDSVTVKGSVFYNNKARLGGAMYIEGSTPTIDNCYFEYNGRNNSTIQTVAGGAIYIKDSNPVLHRIKLVNNSSIGGGGAIVFDNSSPVVTNILAVKNITEGYGGAIQLINGSSPRFVNATFSDNSATAGGSIYLNPNSNPEILNSILYSNSKPEIYLSNGTTPNVIYSLVDGASNESYFGEGCLDEDPLFKQIDENNYRLKFINCGDDITSPAIDAGHPDSLDAVLDCGEGLGTARADMGYYGGRYSEMIVDVANENRNEIPTKYDLSQNYPNPFNPTTTIAYSIPSVIARSPANDGKQSAVNVTLIVYNILGQKVATLVNKQLSPGNYSTKFNATNLSSGIYFYRLQAGSFVATKKMILMK